MGLAQKNIPLVSHKGCILLCSIFAISFTSCKKSKDDTMVPMSNTASNVLYVESNNIDQNSIIAYHRNTDGSLSSITGSPFLTGGQGVGNPDQILGPDDSDQSIMVSSDHKKLFAVNSGSNTIAVFNIAEDGSLSTVPGSPFPSGGTNPVSIGIAGSYLYVVNKNENPSYPSIGTPNYTSFSIAADGSISSVPGSTINTAAGVSPSQALISKDQKFLFGTDFFGPMKGLGTLRSFLINSNGTLTPAIGTPKKLTGVDSTGAALGLASHPSKNILYVGHVMRDTMGVYTYDNSGELTFIKGVKNSGKAICWIKINADGSKIYTSNTGDGSVSYYNNSDPLNPIEIQKVVLKDLGPSFIDGKGKTQIISSAPFQLSLDPLEKYLYVINQRVTTEASYTGGNTLHILSISSDGSMMESLNEINLEVPASSRPQGIVVF